MTSTQHTGSQDALPITAVERETGIAKDTLRVWEKRYGFPKPLRDAADDRRYPPDQVQRLKRIRRLLDAGHRPGKVVHLDDVELNNLLDKTQDLSKTKIVISAASTELENLEFLLQRIDAHQAAELRDQLQHMLMRKGVTAFVHDVAAPLTTAVGEAWAQGRFEVFGEHLYTEVMTNVLRSNLETLRHTGLQKMPKVLLTTVPQELHGLGLLMVESLLTLEGCTCISLGTQTPLGDIVQAAAAYEVDVVALSFSNVHSAAAVQNCLRDLRKALPRERAIWVGGSCISLYQKPLEGMTALQDLEGLPALVESWRMTHQVRD
ncbi:cobalamin-dependent protein [Comamonas sp. Y33R10-2]|uniref:MerR family transcriptional regulator n=1 Tax=Comamonas sp. Y33R10-2 TaxID=2853257 RepID=UPI001C5C88CC|nr:MerR family transcriptional regulator [Comamonas sp. Y33R10-2]QXZ10640.1 cobalamin-dependent protein [Comamonas sp. Y33R10-2]